MGDSALELLTQINLYSISLIIVLFLFLVSRVSKRVKEQITIPLQICTIIWLIFFGYKVYTGDNLYHVLTEPSQAKIDAARYKKVMIDGREVIYEKDTGKIVKPSKK